MLEILCVLQWAAWNYEKTLTQSWKKSNWIQLLFQLKFFHDTYLNGQSLNVSNKFKRQAVILINCWLNIEWSFWRLNLLNQFHRSVDFIHCWVEAYRCSWFSNKWNDEVGFFIQQNFHRTLEKCVSLMKSVIKL